MESQIWTNIRIYKLFWCEQNGYLG
jgi:hypothetical protein